MDGWMDWGGGLFIQEKRVNNTIYFFRATSEKNISDIFIFVERKRLSLK
jgi:hypothetical protein